MVGQETKRINVEMYESVIKRNHETIERTLQRLNIFQSEQEKIETKFEEVERKIKNLESQNKNIHRELRLSFVAPTIGQISYQAPYQNLSKLSNKNTLGTLLLQEDFCPVTPQSSSGKSQENIKEEAKSHQSKETESNVNCNSNRSSLEAYWNQHSPIIRQFFENKMQLLKQELDTRLTNQIQKLSEDLSSEPLLFQLLRKMIVSLNQGKPEIALISGNFLAYTQGIHNLQNDIKQNEQGTKSQQLVQFQEELKALKDSRDEYDSRLKSLQNELQEIKNSLNERITSSQLADRIKDFREQFLHSYFITKGDVTEMLARSEKKLDLQLKYYFNESSFDQIKEIGKFLNDIRLKKYFASSSKQNTQEIDDEGNPAYYKTTSLYESLDRSDASKSHKLKKKSNLARKQTLSINKSTLDVQNKARYSPTLGSIEENQICSQPRVITSQEWKRRVTTVITESKGKVRTVESQRNRDESKLAC